MIEAQEEAVRERAVSMGEIEGEHIRLGYNIIQRMYSKMDEPSFWEAFKPKYLTAGVRAINELIAAIAKSRPEATRSRWWSTSLP